MHGFFLSPLCFASWLSSVAAHHHHDSGRNHKCEGGRDHQGDPGLSQLQETAHQHAGSGKGEWCHQWALLRRHALPQVVYSTATITAQSGQGHLGFRLQDGAYCGTGTTGSCWSHKFSFSDSVLCIGDCVTMHQCIRSECSLESQPAVFHLQFYSV